MDKRYFAALEPKEILPQLVNKIRDYDNAVLSSGMFNRARKSYQYYYGFAGDGRHAAGGIAEGGDSGELALVKINEFRNYLQHILIMTTQDRPAFKPMAVNTDSASSAQCVIAEQLLEYYMREKKIDRKLKMATEISLVMGEGFIGTFWNQRLGKQTHVDPDTDQIMNEGDIECEVYTPFDIIRNPNKDNFDQHTWLMVRKIKNKYDLAVAYPEYAEDIINMTTSEEVSKLYSFTPTMLNEDDVFVYEFYHAKTDTLPNGRIVAFLDDKTMLYDTAMPYRSIPIRRITPAEMIKTTFGYTVAYDLMGIQEMTDGTMSSIASNIKAFGTQHIWTPTGIPVDVRSLAEGMCLYQSDKKPEGLDLVKVNPALFNFLDWLKQYGETISAVSSVNRGQPEASLKSGSALALVASQAILFNSGLQHSYAAICEDVGTDIIVTIKDFAKSERVVLLAGKSNESRMKTFTGDDLESIDRVVVNVGSAISKTAEGKIEIANNLLQQGFIKNPDEYIMALTTGRLEHAVDPVQSQQILIKQENEALTGGENVQAITTDNHPKHIQGHLTVLAQVEVRKDPNITNAALGHIMEHYDLMRTTAPDLLMLVGVEPLPPQAAPMGGPAPMPLDNPAPPQPNMPSMPTNPLTGEQFNPTTG